MSAPSSAGTDLLDFATEVVNAPSPRPAALRRAVSAAYYAVFHELVRMAVRQAMGSDPDHDEDRHIASRWCSHRNIWMVSKWVLARAQGHAVPQLVGSLLDAPPPDLVTVAETVNKLQDARNNADYNPAADISVARTKAAVDQARAALAGLARLAGNRVAENYLTLLLGGPRLSVR